jgi:hypothetical protein
VNQILFSVNYSCVLQWFDLKEWSDAGLGHTKPDFLRKYPFTLNQDRILKKVSLGKAIQNMDTK